MLSTSFAGGADLQMVKDRLGHGSISTTEKYLHGGSGIASGGRGAAGGKVSVVSRGASGVFVKVA